MATAADSFASLLAWDNKTLRALPVDDSEAAGVRSVRGACFSLVRPTAGDDPELVCVSEDAAHEVLGPAAAARLLAAEAEGGEERRRAAALLCGNEVVEGARPAAHCYCGFQFGTRRARER